MAMLCANTAFGFDDNGLEETRNSFVLHLTENAIEHEANPVKEVTGGDLYLTRGSKKHAKCIEQLEQIAWGFDNENFKRTCHTGLGQVIGKFDLDVNDTLQSNENLLAESHDNDVKYTEHKSTDREPDRRYEKDSRYNEQRTTELELGKRNDNEFKYTHQTARDLGPDDAEFKDTGQRAEPSEPLSDTGQSKVIVRKDELETNVEGEWMSNKELSNFTTENAEHFNPGHHVTPNKTHVFLDCNEEKNFLEDAKHEHAYALWQYNHFPGTSKTKPKDACLKRKHRNRQEICSKISSSSSSKVSFTTKDWIPLTARNWIRLCTTCFSFGILLLSFTGVGGTLTAVPGNTIVHKGERARLTCSTNTTQHVYWMRMLTGSGDQQWLYYGESGFNTMHVDGRFSVDTDDSVRRHDLVIDDVQTNDAGQYICIDESGLGMSAAAELVVSGSMHCNTDKTMTDGVMAYNVFDIQQNSIQLSCNISYKGNIAPSLIWNWPGSEKQREFPVITVTSSSFTSTLVLSPTKELNGATFSCQATVPDAAYANSDERLIWKSKPIVVGYAEFEEKPVPECPGISWNLICNPPCSYTFLKTDDLDCKCNYTYRYELKHRFYSTTSQKIACEKPETSESITVTPIVAGAITGAMVFLSVLIGVTIGVIVQRKRKLEYKKGTVLQTHHGYSFDAWPKLEKTNP